MSFKSSVNGKRRAIMRGLTRNIGRSALSKDAHGISNSNIRRVLISRPNSRLGNQLLITPLVQEISDTFPNCKVDLFVRGNISCLLFENYESVERIIKLPKKPFKELFKYMKVWLSLKKYKYDIVINVDKDSASGRLSTQFSNARFKFFNNVDENLQVKYEDYEQMAKFPVYNFRNNLIRLEFNEVDIDKPIPVLNIKLSPSEIATGKEILDSLVDKGKKTISIYTYATGDKCYSKDWWLNVYERFKAEYGERYNILEVLPVENVSQIDFKAPFYYSKDIREITAFINNTEVFIGADSGIMHLASAAQTPVVGLFSVTNIQKYKPYNEESVVIDTNTMDIDDIVNAINKILEMKK
jgi:ADP-heptose:LPS heptosyltransferase